MDDLNFFDAHCYVGRYKAFRPGSFYTRAGLLKYMDHFGIREALVTHSLSREHHPTDGNAAVLTETRGSERLHPSWALLPPASKELPSPAEVIPMMIKNGVRAVKILHGSYHFPISDWCIGELLDELEAHRVPTFFDPDSELDTVQEDKFDWDAVDTLCRSHPKLPIILSEARFHSSNRILYQLFEKHPNLQIELSGLWANQGIEFITKEFGAARLLFGTRMPVRCPGCVVTQVTYSNVSDEAKNLIAGDNLRKLMEGVVE